MSNTGFGLRPVGRVGGGMCRVREYYIPSTDSGTYGEGDVVELLTTTGAMDPLNEVPVVQLFATGKVPVGVIVGFRPIASLPYTGHYRPASTGAYVQVCDDPDAIYEVQEDGVTSVISAANVGAMKNCPLNVVAATAASLGISGTMLTSNSVTASISDVKILGVKRTGNNVAAQVGGAILLVRLLGAVQPGSALTSTLSINS